MGMQLHSQLEYLEYISLRGSSLELQQTWLQTEGRSTVQPNPATQLVPPPMKGFLNQFVHPADLILLNPNLGELELETLLDTE